MKNPVFRTLYLVYLGLLFIAAFVVLGILWKKLVLFQRSEEEKEITEERLRREEQAPQLFFMEYAEELNAQTLASEYLADHPESLDTLQTATLSFDELLAKDAEGCKYYRANEYSDENPAYLVELSGEKLAEVKLAGKGLNWAVEDVEVFADAAETVTADIPDGYRIRCNDNLLGDDHIAEAGIVRFPYDKERETFGYDEVLKNEIKWNVYSAKGFLTQPEVEILDTNGSALSQEETADIVLFGSADDSTSDRDKNKKDFVRIHPDEKSAQKLQDAATGFLEAYLIYYTYGKSGIDDHIAAAQSYCFAGSPADKSLINAYEDSVSWAYGHTNLRNEILQLGNPVMWADNCCSVDIEYHAYAKRGGEELDYSRRDEMIRIMLVDKGNGYKVYAFDVSPVGQYF